MSSATSRSDGIQRSNIQNVRVAGGVTVGVIDRDGTSIVKDLGQRDGYKVRFPKRGSHPEAVIINTGGGLASGDHVKQNFKLGPNSALTVTTQASERVYRQLDSVPAQVHMAADVGENASLNWLPQETILFDGAGLNRTFSLDLHETGRTLLCETLVLGREAMGETVANGSLHDRWRVRRNGHLVFAEDIRFDDDAFRAIHSPIIASGARLISTSLLLAPDAEDYIERVRKLLENFETVNAAASAWNGTLVIRAMASGIEKLRPVTTGLVQLLASRQLPRVWQT